VVPGPSYLFDPMAGGTTAKTNDAYVGAVADVLDDAVVTDTPADFEALGVDVETC